jgi:hypothetical protein
MKRTAFEVAAFLSSIAGMAIAAACSSEGAHPPQLGGCGAADASCATSTVGGGSSGGTDAGGTCTASAGNSQCGLCETAQCCSLIETCLADAVCAGFLKCENMCAGAANCESTCQGRYPQGPAAVAPVTTCALAKCPVCSQLGVGDPCSTGTCNPGLTCQDDLWCSKACVHSSDCAGFGPDGANTLGLPNACLATGTCYAGCSTNDDCQSMPGTFCNTVMSIEQIPVTVCQSMRDAAVSD